MPATPIPHRRRRRMRDIHTEAPLQNYDDLIERN